MMIIVSNIDDTSTSAPTEALLRNLYIIVHLLSTWSLYYSEKEREKELAFYRCDIFYSVYMHLFIRISRMHSCIPTCLYVCTLYTCAYCLR